MFEETCSTCQTAAQGSLCSAYSCSIVRLQPATASCSSHPADPHQKLVSQLTRPFTLQHIHVPPATASRPPRTWGLSGQKWATWVDLRQLANQCSHAW